MVTEERVAEGTVLVLDLVLVVSSRFFCVAPLCEARRRRRR